MDEFSLLKPQSVTSVAPAASPRRVGAPYLVHYIPTSRDSVLSLPAGRQAVAAIILIYNLGLMFGKKRNTPKNNLSLPFNDLK
jgi:hypothetical protein